MAGTGYILNGRLAHGLESRLVVDDHRVAEGGPGHIDRLGQDQREKGVKLPLVHP